MLYAAADVVRVGEDKSSECVDEAVVELDAVWKIGPGAAKCPPGQDVPPDKCQAAVNSLAPSEFPAANVDRFDVPPGCSFNPGAREAYFNIDGSGTNPGNFFVVCAAFKPSCSEISVAKALLEQEATNTEGKRAEALLEQEAKNTEGKRAEAVNTRYCWCAGNGHVATFQSMATQIVPNLVTYHQTGRFYVVKQENLEIEANYVSLGQDLPPSVGALSARWINGSRTFEIDRIGVFTWESNTIWLDVDGKWTDGNFVSVRSWEVPSNLKYAFLWERVRVIEARFPGVTMTVIPFDTRLDYVLSFDYSALDSEFSGHCAEAARNEDDSQTMVRPSLAATADACKRAMDDASSFSRPWEDICMQDTHGSGYYPEEFRISMDVLRSMLQVARPHDGSFSVDAERILETCCEIQRRGTMGAEPWWTTWWSSNNCSEIATPVDCTLETHRNEWSPKDGGVDKACRGQDPNSAPERVQGVCSLYLCKDYCRKTPRCTGFSFQHKKQSCEVWTTPIQTTDVDGSLCVALERRRGVKSAATRFLLGSATA